MKKNILMLVPHHPDRDPRIKWEASSAAKNFNVLVVGTCASLQEAETKEQDSYFVKNYPIVFARRHLFLSSSNFFKLLPLSIQFLAGMVFLILFPLLFLLNCLKALIKLALLGNQSLFKLLFKYAPVLTQKFTMADFEKSVSISRTKLIRLIKKFPTLVKSINEWNTCKWHFSYISAVTAIFWKEITTSVEKPDVIHCNDIYSLLAGVMAKKKFGYKVIYDAHEYSPYTDPHAIWFKVLLFKWYEKFLINKVDAVVTVNPLLASLLKKDYELKNDVFSVPNAEPWKEHDIAKTVNGPMTKLANGRIKFLFQGGFSPGRGIEELIKVWANVDGTKAALFLRGPLGYYRDLNMNLANALGLLDKSVYFLESIAEDDLVEAAKEADVGIIPYRPIIVNHIYACPNKLSQYMQAGLMIISDNLLYVKQILEEGKAGMVYDSNNAESMLHVIRTAIEDNNLREEFKKNALNYSKNKFNWDKAYKTLDELYVNLTSSNIV